VGKAYKGSDYRPEAVLRSFGNARQENMPGLVEDRGHHTHMLNQLFEHYVRRCGPEWEVYYEKVPGEEIIVFTHRNISECESYCRMWDAGKMKRNVNENE